jgi:hypothetical protein
MPLAGAGAIAIWNDIIPEKRDAFFEWHSREHMPERLGIPGFLRGRRYAAIQADIEFVTLYEAPSVDTFQSDAYKARLGKPTPWSVEVLPGFRNNLRGVCRLIFTAAHADGGFLWTLRLDEAPGRRDELIAALQERLLPLLIEKPKVTGVHLLVCDNSLSGTNTALQRGRTITAPNLIVMIEGSAAEGPRAAGEALSEDLLMRHGAANGGARGLYNLEYSIAKIHEAV